jgi:hypothetical protein
MKTHTHSLSHLLLDVVEIYDDDNRLFLHVMNVQNISNHRFQMVEISIVSHLPVPTPSQADVESILLTKERIEHI